jgi:hypothetical protein
VTGANRKKERKKERKRGVFELFLSVRTKGFNSIMMIPLGPTKKSIWFEIENACTKREREREGREIASLAQRQNKQAS